MKNNSFIKDTLVLFVITLVLGILLSVVKTLTDIPIRLGEEKAKREAFLQVCAEYDNGEEVINKIKDINSSKTAITSALIAKNANGDNVGYIIQATTKGYGGDIDLIIGFGNDKKVTGIAFPTSLSETPGLGMRVTEDPFKSSFNGKGDQDLASVDTLTGATISSSAVKNAILDAAHIVDKM